MSENESGSNRLGKPGAEKPGAEKPGAEKPQTAAQKKKADKKAANQAARAEKYKNDPKFPPYKGKGSLPAATKDKKGKVQKAGKMHFSLVRSGENLKVVGHYRNGKGVATKLIRVLKVRKQTPRGAKDRAFLNELKLNGVIEQ